jgi:predicted regulator of Ras-like GTPase activity (Roadblock/LC7/MglB family)
MSSIRVRLLPAVIEQLQQRLQQALDEQPALYALVLGTADGRRIGALNRMSLDEGRLAALSSTLLSMAAAATTELRGGRPNECIVLFDSGTACFSRVGFEGRFVLCAAADGNLNLGMLISNVRRIAPDLSALLDKLIERS